MFLFKVTFPTSPIGTLFFKCLLLSFQQNAFLLSSDGSVWLSCLYNNLIVHFIIVTCACNDLLYQNDSFLRSGPCLIHLYNPSSWNILDLSKYWMNAFMNVVGVILQTFFFCCPWSSLYVPYSWMQIIKN